jgi:putative acetyltransferase
MDLLIRTETGQDIESIGEVNQLAFGQDDEGALVDALRAGGDAVLSMVAEVDGIIVGHIFYSELKIIADGQTTRAIALAPMSVRPEFQRQGIGSQLIETSLRKCRDDGHQIVIVLGHPDYYPRFGFSAPLAKPLKSPYAGDSFMALELVAGALQGVIGTVRYAPPFEAL